MFDMLRRAIRRYPILLVLGAVVLIVLAMVVATITSHDSAHAPVAGNGHAASAPDKEAVLPPHKIPNRTSVIAQSSIDLDNSLAAQQFTEVPSIPEYSSDAGRFVNQELWVKGSLRVHLTDLSGPGVFGIDTVSFGATGSYGQFWCVGSDGNQLNAALTSMTAERNAVLNGTDKPLANPSTGNYEVSLHAWCFMTTQ
jgi:hypothetical protein